MSNIIINILAIVGLVILISYLISYIYYYFKSKKDQSLMMQVNPPNQYMQESGIKCPDYWVNTGVDENGNYICKNMFNLNVLNKTTPTSGKCLDVKCYQDGTGAEKIVNFSPIDSKSTWEPNNPNGKTSLTSKEKYDFVNSLGESGKEATVSRCDWIKCCGSGNKDESDNVQWNAKGIWQGINSTCSYSPNSVGEAITA
jgi:hypothetical protein